KKREKALLKEKKKKEKEEKQKAKKDKVRYSSENAANALIRVLALGIDLAIFYLLLSFYGQEELVTLVSDFIPLDKITDMIFSQLEIFVPNFNELFASFAIETPRVFLSLCLGLYSIFFLYRLVTTLILKVSLGQFLLGLNVRGNALLKRFLGFIREV